MTSRSLITRRASCTGLLLVLTAFLAVLAYLPSPADAATYPDRVGISGTMRWYGQSDLDAELTRMRDGGVTWYREDFRWDGIETAKGVYNWTHPDRLMTGAAHVGVNILPIVWGSPRWISTGSDHRYPPRSYGDYADFMRVVLARYGPNGSFWLAHPELIARPITAVEVWNEPWCLCTWNPEPDPPEYARLARQAIAAARPIAPTTKFLISGDYLQSRQDRSHQPWLENLLKADPTIASIADGYAMHPYPNPWRYGPYDSPAPMFNYEKVRLAHEVALSRDAELPIWITEIGWSEHPDDPNSISETKQAEYIGGAIERALNEWGTFVEKIFIYSWHKPGEGARDRFFGLRNADNSTRKGWDVIKSYAGAPGAPPTPGAPNTGGGTGPTGPGGTTDPDGTASTPTVVLGVDDLDPLPAAQLEQAEARGLFASVDLALRQAKKKLMATGLDVKIACAPSCLANSDVTMRRRRPKALRLPGASRYQRISLGAVRFVFQSAGSADVKITLNRQGKRLVKNGRAREITFRTVFLAPNGQRQISKRIVTVVR